MITCILVDDEPNNVEALQYMLEKQHPSIRILHTAHSVDEALAFIQLHPPDLVFLDIQMPGKNGFDLLAQLPDRSLEVIFVTAYDQYGIHAVKYSALDYLLKPIDEKELEAAIHKAEERIEAKRYNINLEHLIRNMKDQAQDPTLALSIGYETRFVNVSSIVRCKADNNYTEIYLQSGEIWLISKTLKEYDELLTPQGFLRVHQSHLINRSYIARIKKGLNASLILKDGTEIPIARQKKNRMMQQIEQ
jgi:two-component system LytT family response regulator